MISALLYLRVTSLKNLVLSRARRLKQPKYLLGALFGAAYLYSMIARRFVSSRVRAGDVAALVPSAMLQIIGALGSLALAAYVISCWAVPDQRASLTFSEAEIAFLFPAPVKRKTLISYHLLNAQLRLFLTSAILTLVASRFSFLGGNALTHALGWWLILATLSLHATAASFVITRLMDDGITPWRRRWVVLGMVALVLAGTLLWLRRDAQTLHLADLTDLSALGDAVERLLTIGPLPWLLLPGKLLLAPLLARDGRGFVTALGPALVIFAAHYWWVFRSAVSFEDASIAKSQKRAVRSAAVRAGKWPGAGATIRRPDPFRLVSVGRPELAFLWKNLLSTLSLFRPRTLLVVGAAVFVGCQWLAGSREYRFALPMVWGFAVLLAVYTLLLGPQFARQDLRSDLVNADLLKTYPLRGWQIVLGELLTPTVILTGLLWLSLLMLVSFDPQEIEVQWGLSAALRIAVLGGLAVVSPLLCAMQLLVPNAAAVVFPAWVLSMSNRGERGIEVVGQRLFFAAGRLLVMALSLLPALLVAGALGWAALLVLGPVAAAVFSALGAVFVLVGETWWAVRWLGARFERFDLSSELRP